MFDWVQFFQGCMFGVAIALCGTLSVQWYKRRRNRG